jgi:hypothetical protein
MSMLYRVLLRILYNQNVIMQHLSFHLHSQNSDLKDCVKATNELTGEVESREGGG